MASFVLTLEIMGAGGALAGLGALVFLLTAGQLIVIYGLWTLRPWGWKWAIVLFSALAFVNLVQGEVLPALVGVGIATYVYAKRERYRD